MAIEITKTLVGTEYVDLCFKTSLIFSMTDLVVLDMKGYETAAHVTDNFLPILQRQEAVTDPAATASFNSVYYTNPSTAIAAIEAWLIANVAYYAGGSVV